MGGHHMRGSIKLLVAGALVCTGIIPATADEHEEIVPLYRAEQVYFQCHGGDEEKNQNLYDTWPWSLNAPSRSVTDGAGCGYINSGAAGNAPTFEGEFTGNLRDLRVEMHIFPSFVHPLSLTAGEIDLAVTLVVDGEVIADGTLTGVPAELESGNFETTQTVVFGIDGLDEHFGVEDGFGSITRSISLSVGTANPAEIVDWVWQTSEVPAGITFNQAATPALPAG
jgi:hypothetical protein